MGSHKFKQVISNKIKIHIMSANTTKFKHVSYLWDDAKAAELAGDEVGLLIYRSNLLGADLRLTNYGGGNTSCKVMDKIR
ncbi:short chain dehydrogenase [mine drainage metagenome]|uniref:Short chain dehydrogenase n=1 Tax=mine drainage metagenome TaxID=410659 RepID=A0A1J5P0W2_9ZZZZ